MRGNVLCKLATLVKHKGIVYMMLECDERSMIVKIEVRCNQGLSDGNDGWPWLICVLLKQIMSLPQCVYELHVYVLISYLFVLKFQKFQNHQSYC